jgi:hypothetical protein
LNERAVLLLALALAACDGATHYIGIDCFPSGDGAALQAAIDAHKNEPHNTVLLCPRAEITLDAPLVLPQGLTLETAGRPKNVADKATIRLGAQFPAQAGYILRSSGSDIHLVALRVDGNRRLLGPRDGQALIELGPGSDYEVADCNLTDGPGWTHLHLIQGCNDSKVTGNVVESADRPHDSTGHYSDGLSIACAHSLIADNEVNDVSGVGIVYYGGPGTTIRDNKVILTKTSAFSGVNVGDAIVPDNTGVVVERNELVAKPPRYFQTGFTAGLHVIGKTTNVAGVTLRNNKLSGMARYGLAIDGCLDCTIQDNDVTDWHPLPPVPLCPAPAAYVAAVTAVHASGTLQPGYTDAKIDDCPGEPEVLGPVYREYAGDATFPDYLAFEVLVFSQRMEQQLDAMAMLRTEWDLLAARAKAICPAGTPADLQAVWRRIAEAQFRAKLAPAEADAKVRADLAAAPAGTPCGPT